MAIVKPVIFTSIDDAEVLRNRPVSEELVRKMIQNSNLFGSLAMVASIAHIQLNLSGVPAPNPDIWQIATGGEITHLDSPLKTVAPVNRFTPDMTNRYVRGASAPGAGNNGSAGSATVNLNHTHTIGQAPNGGLINDGNDSPNYVTPTHNHDLSSDLSSAEPLEMSHQELAVYMKIN